MAINFPRCSSPESPGPPAGVFNLARCFAARTLVGKKTRLIPGSRVGDRQGHADCERGELINRVPAGAPVRQFLFVELLGHARVPFARYWPDHRAGVEFAAIDTHRAAEVAADLERGAGGCGSFRSSSFGQMGTRDLLFYADKRSGLPEYCAAQRG